MSEYPDTDDDQLALPSKSQLKREAKVLFIYSKYLHSCRDSELKLEQLSSQVRNAVQEGRKLSSHGARKRNAQYVARLLRAESDEPDQSKDSVIHNSGSHENDEIPNIPTNSHEKMIIQLTSNQSAAIPQLQERYPGLEIQRVRQLVRELAPAKHIDSGDNKPPVSTKANKAHQKLLLLLAQHSIPS